MDLTHLTTLHLYPCAPFNFDASLHKPDHFPSTDTAWQPGIRWQTMFWEGQILGLKFENRGALDRPEIALSVWSQAPLEADFQQRLGREITYRLNLDLDLEPFNRRFSGDPRFGEILRRWVGMRPATYSSLYEYLMIAIVLQNATVRRSVNMLQTLFEHYGSHVGYDERELSAFWAPETIAQTSEDELRALKVGYRAKSILRVSQAFANRQIDEFELRRMDLPDQRQALLDLYGVGPASAGYILFDVFHRWDQLDHISPWEQKIFSRLFFDRDPEDPVPVEDLIAFFDRHFSPYRMLAVNYIWEDLWWRRKNEPVEWLERLIRL